MRSKAKGMVGCTSVIHPSPHRRAAEGSGTLIRGNSTTTRIGITLPLQFTPHENCASTGMDFADANFEYALFLRVEIPTSANGTGISTTILALSPCSKVTNQPFYYTKNRQFA